MNEAISEYVYHKRSLVRGFMKLNQRLVGDKYYLKRYHTVRESIYRDLRRMDKVLYKLLESYNESGKASGSVGDGRRVRRHVSSEE